VGVEFGVVTVAAVKMAAAVYFAVAVVLMLLLMITGFRFHGAYFRAYGGEEGRRRHWLLCGWPMGWRGTRPPPWTLSAWLRPLDDPLVERRRHQYQLAWGGWIALIVAPVAFLLYASVFLR
jgi:hypothetical protein